jgi:predicted MFS family arabinose efflux permease
VSRLGSRGGLGAAALAVAVATAFADSSIVVLALPDLLSEFDASIPGVAWTVTAYNLAVAVVALALAAPLRRFGPAPLARVGLVLFVAASAVCAAAGGLTLLVAARAVQGVGAALLLAGALPLLGAELGSAARGARAWGTAALVGAAVGPALGGALTQAFDWRSIFIAQIPLAAVALAAVWRRAAPEPPPAPASSGPPSRSRIVANAGLALVSGALVGALFLAVVLAIDGWGHAPLVAALIVSLLPLGAVAAVPLSAGAPPRVAAAAGAILLAGGLVSLGLLPESSLWLMGTALAICGLGLGLSAPPLTHAALDGTDPARLPARGTWSVGARHVGLVVGLLLVTPLLNADLRGGGDRALLAGTALVVEAPIGIDTKVALGRDLAEAVDEAPAGETPELGPVFEAQAREDPDARPALAELRGRLETLIEGVITRGFRRAFLACAILAALAGPAVLLIRRSALP